MRVLMVSPEFPPMNGGVGRYTMNLTKVLQKLGLDVITVCDENGDGDYFGISPSNPSNSDNLLKTVKEVTPDIVHVQFEPGMYGLNIDTRGLRCTGTYIDSFYDKCQIPIVTTFHSTYNLHDWISQANLVKKNGRLGKFGIPLRFVVRFWKYSMSYRSFHNLNRQKLLKSRAGIVFSRYMSRMLGSRSYVIYHGAEPAASSGTTRSEAKSSFSLPREKRIALALGFKTHAKGWDLLQKLDIPEDWTLVVNSSKGYYNTEDLEINWPKEKKIFDLQKGFLSEEELSMLFFASDVVLLPYKAIAASGVMFDAIGHGRPFIASDLEFFKEFADQGLGIAIKRTPYHFSRAIKNLDWSYAALEEQVNRFKPQLEWNFVAKKHSSIYHAALHP